MSLLHLCDGNSTGCSIPPISVGDFIPLTSCQQGGSGFSFGLAGISCRAQGNILAREREALLSVSLSTRLCRRKQTRQVTSIPIARRQPATPTPRPIFVPLERPPRDVGSLVEVGESVGSEVYSLAVLVVDATLILDEPEPAEVAGVEPEPVKVDAELEYVVLPAKIHPFI